MESAVDCRTTDAGTDDSEPALGAETGAWVESGCGATGNELEPKRVT